ncbi:hypothetical protein BDV95DRAFT_562268 [Massariosphaeria phaeospora]|uniref:Uncharacterized protein n=1 Tax=Massariosphaeria phaeospora TaxID=100035 RepID=A0A7C8MDJ7_9PLEO|nr:hypothetical protein BDV95DRAFT_562268 [Massariosphaeria phaeospora]
MTPPPPVLSITALSTYALYLSYANITRLQTYEARSEKAAEWSTKAAERLRKTRMTQASAAISVCKHTHRHTHTHTYGPSHTIPSLTPFFR